MCTGDEQSISRTVDFSPPPTYFVADVDPAFYHLDNNMSGVCVICAFLWFGWEPNQLSTPLDSSAFL